MEDKKSPVENIRFGDLHPLYGAVDIRNATILRNQALANDYTIQLRILIETISSLNDLAMPQIQRVRETAATDLQHIYPGYFEKFRPDGVEYDVYGGQSIAPKKTFLSEHLQRMKRWQLTCMVEVVKLTHDLLLQIDFQLQPTQTKPEKRAGAGILTRRKRIKSIAGRCLLIDCTPKNNHRLFLHLISL